MLEEQLTPTARPSQQVFWTAEGAKGSRHNKAFGLEQNGPLAAKYQVVG